MFAAFIMYKCCWVLGADVSTTHFLGRFDDNPWTSVSWLSAGSTLSCGFELSCRLETWTARFRRLLRFRFGSLASGSTVNSSIGSSAVQSSTGWLIRGNKPVEGWQGTSRTMWSGSGAVSDDDVHAHECHCTVRHFVWNLLLARF